MTTGICREPHVRRRGPARAGVATLLALSLSAGSSVPLAARGQATAEPLAARIDGLLASWNRPDAPGCSVGVSLGSETVFEKGYGSANLEHRVAITPASVFHVASVTKPFTAMSILLLARDGKIGLDDEVRRYLPEWQGVWRHRPPPADAHLGRARSVPADRAGGAGRRSLAARLARRPPDAPARPDRVAGHALLLQQRRLRAARRDYRRARQRPAAARLRRRPHPAAARDAADAPARRPRRDRAARRHRLHARRRRCTAPGDEARRRRRPGRAVHNRW